MKMSERMMYFHRFGLDIEKLSYDRCVEELIEKHKDLLEYVREKDMNDFKSLIDRKLIQN